MKALTRPLTPSVPLNRSAGVPPALRVRTSKRDSDMEGHLWPPKRPCGQDGRAPAGKARGSILLEVVLALVIFAAAAAVIGTGLKSAIDGVERLRLQTHASNLAVSVLSELQMGARSLDGTGPEPFAAPFAGWTWEITAQPWGEGRDEDAPLTLVEVIVRSEDPVFVHRLAQVMPPGANARKGTVATLNAPRSEGGP
jgi:hypothetical protein